MGKTQSKRSVDITTDASKKCPEEGEVTGKLEKIEDLDQKQVNGDATPQECNDTDKKDADESENDKDLTTEKSGGEVVQTSGDDQSTALASAESTKEDVAEAAGETKEGAPVEDISPLSDDSAKKSKKEKVKKKWSFRSISFGKKDKQKPAKAEDTETVVATNGEGDKAIAEGITEATSIKDEAVNAVTATAAGGDEAEEKLAETGAEILENGEATEKKLNGQKSPTPTEEKKELGEVVAANTTAAIAATTNTTNITTTEKTVVVEAISSSNKYDDKTATNENNETEKKVAVETIKDAATATLSNGEDKNVVAEVVTAAAAEEIKEVAAVVTDKVAPLDEVVTEAVVAVAASIPIVVVEEKPHQNGTDVTAAAANGENGETQQLDAEIVDATAELSINKSSQIEVNTTTDNTLPTSCSSSTPPPLLNASNIASNSSYSTTTSSTNTSDDLLPSPNILNIENSENLSDEAESNEVVTETVKVLAEISQETEEQCKPSKSDDFQQVPPPLPISPPPSQVLVFAFNNQSEDEDTSASIIDEVLQTNQYVETTESEEIAAKVLVADNPIEHISEVLETIPEIKEVVGVVQFDLSRISPIPADIVSVETRLSTQENEEDENNDYSSAFSLKALEDTKNETVAEGFLLLDNDKERQQGKTINETDLTMAAAVVDEITVKAIEIIEQQHDMKKDKQKHEEVQQKNPTPPQEQEQLEMVQAEVVVDEQANLLNVNADDSSEIIITDDDKNKVNIVKEIEETSLTKAVHDNIEPAESNTAAPVVVRDVNECDSFNKIVSQIENQHKVKEDCLLQFEKLSLTTEVDVILSTSASDIDADDKQLLSHNLENIASKEIVDVAMDLKENAAAEITQDLPVTCE